jgi:pimeloyl-ACP methyl ester carboxylesterase
MLNTITYPGPGEVPLIIAHGLFGSARNWNVIAKRLSDSRPVVAVDMRNHGGSFHDAEHSYPAMAEDLAEVISAHGGQADLLGHSMGGKAAMTLALQGAPGLRHLLVADIAPVAYGHSQGPVVSALQAVELDAVTRRSDADAQLAAHLEDPMLRAFLTQSLAIEEGRARWKLNLDALAEQMPRIMDFPAIDGWFDGRVTVIRGGESDYVSPEHEPMLKALFPQAEIVTMEGRGHWLHAEDPRGFEAVLRKVLD